MNKKLESLNLEGYLLRIEFEIKDEIDCIEKLKKKIKWSEDRIVFLKKNRNETTNFKKEILNATN